MRKGLDWIEYELLDEESRCSEVDEKAVLDSAPAQVAEYLCDVFLCDGSGRFDLDDQFVLYQKISTVLAKNGAIFVADGERVLLFNLDPSAPQPGCKTVLVHLLHMPVAKKPVQFKTRLPHDIAQLKDATIIFTVRIRHLQVLSS